MAIGGIGANDHDHVGELDAVKILRPGRGAEGRLQPITGWRVADACAGIDIVVAKTLPDQLLNEEGLLVGAARRCDSADRSRSTIGRASCRERGWQYV